MHPTSSPFVNFLLRLLGVDVKKIPPDSEVSFDLLNRPQSWQWFVLLLVMVAAAAGVYWLYRREMPACPRWGKRLLAAARIAALFALVAVWLEPAITYTTLRIRAGSIFVLRDSSQSMNTEDRYIDYNAAKSVAAAAGVSVDTLREQQPTRTELLNQVLAKRGPQVFGELQRRGNVQISDFAENVQHAALLPHRSAAAADAPPPSIKPLVAEGRSSDLYVAIQEALTADPLAAIVLLSDGQHTGNDDPRDAARQAKERGVPLLVFGLGDPSRPRNVRVGEVYVRPKVWKNEPFEIESFISAEGAAGREVQIQLVQQPIDANSGQPGEETVVERRSLTLPASGGRAPANFNYTATMAGKYVYSVRAEPLADERLTDDNRAESSVVEVAEESNIRVLLIAGASSWDFRMVERLLQRDPTIDLSCWQQSLDPDRPQLGDIQISELPKTKQELLEYDVILMFDPNPDEFDTEWIDLLKNEFCDKHSGGLLYMAGPKYTNRFLNGSRTGALADILPVRFGNVRGADVISLMSSQPQSWPLRIPPAQIDHPVMALGAERNAQTRWEEMPGVYWSYPAMEPRPTAQTLIEHGDPTLWSGASARPLLVAGRYGSANTLYMGFNGTWRWRSEGSRAEYFDKFWIRTVRFLYDSRKHEGKRRGYLQTDRDRYEIGEKVQITAQVQDANYNNLTTPQLEAVHIASDRAPQRLVLKPVMNQPGRYEGSVEASATGVHSLRVTLPAAPDEASEGEPVAVDASFSVQLPSIETNQVWLDEALLQDLARLSGEGGQYFRLDQLDQLPAATPDATEQIGAPGKPLPLWDKWFTLVIIASLLCVEWAGRKAFKLL